MRTTNIIAIIIDIISNLYSITELKSYNAS